jgi:anti-sigma regulatory factor (Ser/Thr protein kinase)
MRELSLNVMDVVQNSLSAGAALTEILVEENRADCALTITIKDNGRGMTAEQVEKVTDPFYTTRTTRKVGLGVPFFKMSSEMTGGSFSITSQPGVGTEVIARYRTDHIDMTPLGDMKETILLLVIGNPEVDFLYRHTLDGESFALDTRELREILGDVPFSEPDITQWIREYLAEGEAEIVHSS